MKQIFILLIFFIVLYSFTNCNTKKVNEEQRKPVAVSRWAGSYVSPGYNQRDQGYDWVGIRVIAVNDSTANIEIRSRADRKKPTCFLNIAARLKNDSILAGQYNGATLFFTFQHETLSISAADDAPAWSLSWPCSGGASLNDCNFEKIKGELDPSQVDKKVFFKSCMYGNYTYFITVTGDTAIAETLGFIDDETIVIPLNGQQVKDADAGDLNGDGYPELVLFTRTTDSNQMGLIGYSPNNGLSFSMFAWKPITQHPDLSQGFAGFDEMTIIENTLVQRFPLFDPDGNRTGKTRQIQYKLAEGEAMRQLKIDRVIEY